MRREVVVGVAEAKHDRALPLILLETQAEEGVRHNVVHHEGTARQLRQGHDLVLLGKLSRLAHSDCPLGDRLLRELRRSLTGLNQLRIFHQPSARSTPQLQVTLVTAVAKGLAHATEEAISVPRDSH